MNTRWRLIETEKAHPRVNMAWDAAFFECLDQPVLRLYMWEKSYTIGRFQEGTILTPEQRPFSRRLTGGGVLLHGLDVSYTLIAPTVFLGKRSVKEGYEYLCQFLICFYESIGCDAQYAKDLFPENLSHSPYCQVGFEPYDIIIHGKKVGGNAQRRAKDKLLQHGSIPLTKDVRELSGCSLEEVGITLDAFTCKEKLKAAFAQIYGAVLEPSSPTSDEQQVFETLWKEHYDDEAWQRNAKKTTVAS